MRRNSLSRAFLGVRAIGGAVGRWRVEIRQDQIRFTGPANGQALVLRKG